MVLTVVGVGSLYIGPKNAVAKVSYIPNFRVLKFSLMLPREKHCGVWRILLLQLRCVSYYSGTAA